MGEGWIWRIRPDGTQASWKDFTHREKVETALLLVAFGPVILPIILSVTIYYAYRERRYGVF